MACRFQQDGPGYIQTRHRYDPDYNRLEDETGDENDFQERELHIVPTYNAAADTIPAEIYEKLFRLISSTPDQAIMLWHQSVQGIILILLYIIRKIINIFDLYYDYGSQTLSLGII